MNKLALVFGTGGHSRVVVSLLRETYADIKFVSKREEADCICETTLYQEMDHYLSRADFYLAIGDNDIRKRIFLKLKEMGANLPPLVAKHAFVAADTIIEEGSFVAPGAVIMASSRIGQNAIVNTLSSVDHDCDIGEHSQITAGVTIAGSVTCGENTFFGIKSAVVPGIKIGRNCQIMAGALVVKDIGDDLIVGGNPAIVVRRTSK